MMKISAQSNEELLISNKKGEKKKKIWTTVHSLAYDRSHMRARRATNLMPNSKWEIIVNKKIRRCEKSVIQLIILL